MAHGPPRPKSIPELRGMPPVPRERQRSFSAESYTAQYGVTVEDGEDLREKHGKDAHAAIEREIHRMLAADADLKRRALMLDDFETTPEEEMEAMKLMRAWGVGPKRQV